VARPGEIAKIVSKKQFDYFSKQARASKGQGKPLDSRGQSHRAGRDDSGKVVEPGGGAPDPPPDGNEADEALLAFYQNGGKRSQLPDESPTKNASRKESEHAKMRDDQVVAPARRPPGSSEHERQNMSDSGIKNPAKGRYVQSMDGKYHYQTPTNRQAARGMSKLRGTKESLYVSKTIDEDFDEIIDQILGS